MVMVNKSVYLLETQGPFLTKKKKGCIIPIPKKNPVWKSIFPSSFGGGTN